MSDTGILGQRKSEWSYQESITSSDALPPSYRRFVGAKDIKLGLWNTHPAHCWDLNVNVLHMHNVRKVMVYFKPGE